MTVNEADKENDREKQPGGSVVVCSDFQTKPPCFNMKLLISDIVLSSPPAQHVHLAYQLVQVVLSTVNTVLAADTGSHPPLV